MHFKRKLEFLPTTSPTVAVIRSAVALAIVPKVEFNFEIILCITIFVFYSPGTVLLKSAIDIQNLTYLKAYNRSSWFEDSVLVDLPF